MRQERTFVCLFNWGYFTGQTVDWCAMNSAMASLFLERTIQSSSASRACCPSAPSRCTQCISNENTVNLSQTTSTITQQTTFVEIWFTDDSKIEIELRRESISSITRHQGGYESCSRQTIRHQCPLIIQIFKQKYFSRGLNQRSGGSRVQQVQIVDQGDTLLVEQQLQISHILVHITLVSISAFLSNFSVKK